MEKGRSCSWRAISPRIHNIFYLLLSFYVRTGTRISLRDKRLFEITEVETARVDCSSKNCDRNARIESDSAIQLVKVLIRLLISKLAVYKF